jgi:hypothetical protein
MRSCLPCARACSTAPASIKSGQPVQHARAHPAIAATPAPPPTLPPTPSPKVACETATKTGMVMVFGEITTAAKVDYEKVVRDTCREIGFTSEDVGLNCDTCKVLVHIEEQSPDIGQVRRRGAGGGKGGRAARGPAQGGGALQRRQAARSVLGPRRRAASRPALLPTLPPRHPPP